MFIERNDQKGRCLLIAKLDPTVFFSSEFFTMKAVTFKNRNKFFSLLELIECCFECWNDD
jgi:hypothetical protein